MEEDRSNGHILETRKAERSVWLMKCPLVVAKAWRNQTASSSYSSSDSFPVAKVVFSIDPLWPDSSPEFTMEMVGAEFGNMPKSYSLNTFKDFVPMGVFSETNQGEDVIWIVMLRKYIHLLLSTTFVPRVYAFEHVIGRVATEGEVEHKFDMKPHGEDRKEYARLCCERTNKSHGQE